MVFVKFCTTGQTEVMMRVLQYALIALSFVGLTLVAVTANASTNPTSTPEKSGSKLVKVIPTSANNAGPNVTIRVEDNQTLASSQQVYLNPTENRPEDAVIVCRKTETFGSRLRATRVCKSVAQWRAGSAQAREDVNRVNNNDRGGSCLPGPSGGC
jgi:hypothetical protein